MDTLRERINNRFWWASPRYFPNNERFRILLGQVPDWIKIYRIRPGYYTMRVKHQGPSGSNIGLTAFGAVLVAGGLIYVLTQTLFAVSFFAILCAPLWPLILDMPFEKLELVFQPDGNIASRTIAGAIIPLANFNQPYVLRPQAHSERGAAQARGNMLGNVWRTVQGVMSASASLSRRQPSPVLAGASVGQGPTPHDMATELYLIRGAGGAVAVRLAEFVDDPDGRKAVALQGAMEAVISAVKADIAEDRPDSAPRRYE